MAVSYTDKEIEEFIQETKILRVDFWKLVNLRQKRGHKEQELAIQGSNGNQFKLILRESNHNPLDFSVILALCPTHSTQPFRLRRYNGKSHEHTNHIERITFYDFHVHAATLRYQARGTREDAYAEPSERFWDVVSAIECMIQDCNLVIPEGGDHPLFERMEP